MGMNLLKHKVSEVVREELETRGVLEAIWRDYRRLEVFNRDNECNQPERYKPYHGCGNKDVRTTAEAAIARTTLLGIIGRVT